MIDLTAKLGEINHIEHNKDSKKKNPQNQVILDCIMPTIPLKHKCSSIILIWVIFLINGSGLSKKKFFFFTFLNWEKQTWYWEKKGYFRLEFGRKCPDIPR